MKLLRLSILVTCLLLSYQTFAEGTRARERQYAGGRDEEDLKVQNPLPDIVRKVDEMAIQKEVHKNLFKQELKDDTNNDESPETDI